MIETLVAPPSFHDDCLVLVNPGLGLATDPDTIVAIRVKRVAGFR